jgi:hypothetical protein
MSSLARSLAEAALDPGAATANIQHASKHSARKQKATGRKIGVIRHDAIEGSQEVAAIDISASVSKL